MLKNKAICITIFVIFVFLSAAALAQNDKNHISYTHPKKINPLVILTREDNLKELKSQIKTQKITLKNNPLGYELLQVASLNCHYDIIKYLLDADVSPNKDKYFNLNQISKSSFTPLSDVVAFCKSIKPVKLLVSRGANINSSEIPLNSAIYFNKIDVSKYLIDNGANVNAGDKHNIYPIDLSVAMYKGEILDYLLQHHVLINVRHGNTTPLLEAINDNNHDAFLKLIEHGADINFSNNQGLTPLMKATAKRDIDIVSLLIKHGADVNSDSYHFGKYSATALDLAVNNNDLTITQLLIQHGADVNKPNNCGITPLMAAAGNGNLKMVKLLVNNGVIISAVAMHGGTALSWAGFGKHWEVANYLRDKLLTER